jgi:hypothetical protein
MQYMCEWCRRVPVTFMGDVCSMKCHEEGVAAPRDRERRAEQAEAAREAREQAAYVRELEAERANADAALAHAEAEAVRARTEAETEAVRARVAAEKRLTEQRAQHAATAAAEEERRREEAHYVALGAAGRKALAERAKSAADRDAVFAIFDVLGDADSLFDRLGRLPGPHALTEAEIVDAMKAVHAVRPRLMDKRTEMGAIQYWAAGTDREAAEEAFAAALGRLDAWERTFERVREDRRAERQAATVRAATALRAGDVRRRVEADHRFATTAVAVLTLETENRRLELEKLQENERTYVESESGIADVLKRLFVPSLARAYAKNRENFQRDQAVLARGEPDLADELRQAEVCAAAATRALADAPAPGPRRAPLG